MSNADMDIEMPNLFGLTLAEMDAIMSKRSIEALEEVGGLRGVARSLHTDLSTGLGRSDIESNFADRIATFGTNTYPKPPAKSWLHFFWEALQDTTLIILIVAAVVSLVLGILSTVGILHGESWVEGTAILAAVLIVAVVTASNNYSKENQFRSLNDVKNNRTVQVVRNGDTCAVSIFDIVVGDVALLGTGDQVPADGLYISGQEMTVNESAMTGETDSVKKSASQPFMLSGCQVDGGSGSMLVTAIGFNSAWGQTLANLVTEPEPTPLQKKLDVMATSIGKLGLSVAILVFVVLVIYFIDSSVRGFEGPWEWGKLQILVHIFIISVTIVVVAVPEGLPLAVTISLAYSMRQMMTDNNLVRNLAACETMGGATNICSDKTGTLTENRMSVRQGWLAGLEFDKDRPDVGDLRAPDLDPRLLHLVHEGIALNTGATSYFVAPPGKPLEYVGNKTECALLVFASELGCDYKQLRKTTTAYKSIPFSSARKRMSTIVPTKPSTSSGSSGGGAYRLYCKGASELVLQLCSKVMDASGNQAVLQQSQREQLTAKIDEMASEGLRTVCLAFRDCADAMINSDKGVADLEHDLVCIGVVGIKDPLRAEVPAAVALCQQAGIMVRMVTGDNLTTAKKIAQDCGILTDGLAMEGPDFAQLTPEELDDILPRLQVLARSSPTDKLTLVSRLIHNGEVVAVTGDGTNDGLHSDLVHPAYAACRCCC
eukprot:TRINITY_DN1294_c0_g1_i1.p1 TRINITY_DN1294_c0_g1~~TRINITY_DN1294_c0_g1_i1.p1  ORF type:complete len:714 (+),score=318.74 TRINITY_DN1294_c0_g1_i1:185-2326(+)